MRRADAFVQIRDENRAVLDDAGREAFRAGRLTAATLDRLVRVTCRFWRPSPTSPHKGSLVIPTPAGGRRLGDRDLCEFYALGVAGEQIVRTSRATIGRYHQVFGAAHLAAQGDAARAAALLATLLDGQGEHAGGTVAGLLRKARGTKDEPGPPWAAPLRPQRPPAGAARAKVLAQLCAVLDLMALTEPETAAAKGRRLAALLREVTPEDYAKVRRAVDRVGARLARRAAAPMATPVGPAPRPGGLRPAGEGAGARPVAPVNGP